MNTLRTVFLFSLSLLLFASCEEPDVTQTTAQPSQENEPPSTVPDVTPSVATTEQMTSAAIESTDLQGTWQLTHIWYPEEGWVPATTTTLDFYNETFFYSATGWNIEGDTVELFSILSTGDRLSYGSQAIRVEGNRLQIGSDFNYTIRLYQDGKRLLVRAENETNDEANVYHWFVKQ